MGGVALLRLPPDKIWQQCVSPLESSEGYLLT